MKEKKVYARKTISQLMPKDYERMSPKAYGKILKHSKSKALHKAKGSNEAKIIKASYKLFNPDRTNERDHS